MLDARRAEFDVVPRIGFFDTDVMRDAHILLFGFVRHRRHNVAVNAEKFDAVVAVLF